MPTYAEEFSRKVTKQAIARTSLALGYSEAEAVVVDSLADIVRHYIEKISRTSLEIAEGHGRAQPGIHDVIKALESMQSVHSRDWTDLAQFAFPEALSADPSTNLAAATGGEEDGQEGDTENEEEKDASSSSSSSSAAGVGAKSVNKAAWRQPFPHLIPKYPIKQRAKIDTSRLLSEGGGDNASKPAFVPKNLPPFPPSHTYKSDIKKGGGDQTVNSGTKRGHSSSSGGRASKKSKAN